MSKNVNKKAKRRLPALAMAAAMLLSTAVGALPSGPLKAEAAGGYLDILMVDSSVQGGDGNVAAFSLNSNETMKSWGVWDNSVKSDQILRQGEGTARMDGRNLIAYDVTDAYNNLTAGTGGHSPANCIKGSYTPGSINGTYFTQDCLKSHCGTKHAVNYTIEPYAGATSGAKGNVIRISEADNNWLQGGHYYAIVDDFTAARPVDGEYYGYMRNVESDSSDHIGWQCLIKWADGAQLTVGHDAQGRWSTTGTNKDTLIIGYRQQPIHNEVQRGGFKFKVTDVDTKTNASQGTGDINDAVFAVYNINDMAMSLDAFDSTDAVTVDGKAVPLPSNPSAHTEQAARTGATITTGYGYVTVNHPVGAGSTKNVIDEFESQIFYPAYNVNDVISAWKKYLETSANTTRAITGAFSGKETKWFNGLYGVADTDYAIMTGGKNQEYGLFKMPSADAGKPAIIPCMVLKPDANGVVDTGAYALPVGNYLVLQVKAGDGYYIDEDFRPIVSIGPWGGNGYGNAYFGIPVAGMSDASKLNTKAGTVTESNIMGVAYVNSQISDTPDLSACTQFGVDYGGSYVQYSGISNSGANNAAYGSTQKSYPSDWNYTVNPDGISNTSPTTQGNDKAVGTRRRPAAGSSRFTAYDAITRSGAVFYLGDSDDVRAVSAAGSGGTFIVEPQGDGDLSGAKFRLYNNASATALNQWTLSGDAANQKAVQQLGLGSKTALEYGSASYKEYTAQYDAKNGKYYVNIPVDELPFGLYTLKQVSSGTGYIYDKADGETDRAMAVEITIAGIGVYQENHAEAIYKTSDGSKVADVRPKYVIDGTTYIPQELVSGGKLLTVTARDESAKDAHVRVQVFNISDHYVYVDKNGNGTDEKHPTAQIDYQSRIAGKNLSVSDIGSVTSAWGDACVYEAEGTVGTITEAMAADVTELPYGTYYVALTALDPGFSVIGNPGQSSPMHVEGGKVTWSVQIADSSLTPNVATVLLDSEYLIDSVPVKKEASVTDQVELDNLQPGTDYIIYSAIVDKATGDMAGGTSVKYAKVNGYVPPDTAGSFVGGENAADLANEGLTYTTSAQRSEPAYYTWLLKVQDYSKGAGNSMLSNLVSTAMGQFTGSGGASEKTHNAILGVLRYMSGDAAADLPAGIAVAELVHPHMDTTVMEGTTLVGYVFVCEGSEPTSAAMGAKTIGELMAATDRSVRAVHRSLDDEAQTARIPSLDITAEASYSAGHQIDPTETVTGTIEYGNVEVGCSYKIVATLKDSSGNQILGEDGKPLSVTRDFTARDTKGYETVTFEGLDVAKYNGQRLTVYADLMRVVKTGTVETPYWLVTKGDADSMGWHIGDPEPGKNQVDVVVPVVTTNLSDKQGNKEVDFDNQATLVDKVSYQTLIPGETYISVLTLVDSDGKGLFDDNGYALTVEKEFEAKAAAQDVELEITFTATNLRGADVIAFNDLYHITPNQRALVAFEHNTEAPSQTIAASGAGYRIHFTTSVKDDATHTQFSRALTDVGLTDSVTLRNLEPSTPYVLKTELAKAANGDVLTQFEPVYTTVSSDAEGAIKVDVPLKANLSVFAGQTLVVYQTLYNAKETEIVAEHRDHTDANQMVYVSDIDTVLTGGNGRSKKLAPDLVEHEDVTTSTVDGEVKQKVLKTYTYETEVADQIYFSNLTPGNTYAITTEIVTQDGKGTVGKSNLTFTPQNPSGIVTVYLDLDVTDYMGKKLVAFETITDTYSNTTVASHTDLMDEDQTIEIMSVAELEKLKDEEAPGDDIPDDPNQTTGPEGGNPGKNIQTGVEETYGLYFAVAAVLAVLAAGAGLLFWRKRRS